MEYISVEEYVKFVTYKLKERAAERWNQLQDIRMYQGKSPIRTWRQMNILLQARSLSLEEEEIEIGPRPFMRSYWSNKTIKL